MSERQMYLDDDGQWKPATPLPPLGWKARIEWWARGRGYKRVARFFAAWDERGLGR